MVVLFQQYVENTGFFSNFSAGGRHDGGTLLVIPLEFQEIEHQPFPYGTAFGKVRSGNGKGAVCAGSMPLPVEMRPSSAPFRSASAEYASARRDETFAFSTIF